MSAPPVRIESKAWTDHRYKTLALELGLADQNFALIMVATIWRWQTEHYTDTAPTYSVARSVVIGALGSKAGPEAMVAADLAELQDDGTLRIRGGFDDKGRSRIDWLWVERCQRKAAGEASARRRRSAGDPRTPTGRFDELPTSDQRATNETATATERSAERPPSSPFSVLRSTDPDSLSLGGDQPEKLGELAEHAIAQLNAIRAEVDPASERIDLMRAATPSAQGLRDRLREVVPPTDRRRRLDHAIAVLAARARAAGVVDDLTLGQLGGPKSWYRLLDGSLQGAAQARASPGGERRAPARPLTGLSAALSLDD